MKCNKCGAEMLDNAAFCGVCGNKVENVGNDNAFVQPVNATQVQASSMASAATNVMPVYNAPNVSHAVHGPKGGAKFVSVLLSIIMCVGIVALMLLVCARIMISPIGMKVISSNADDNEFADSLEDCYLYKDGIKVKMADFLDDDELEELTHRMASDMVTYMLTGEGEILDSEYIIDVCKEHEDDIEDELGGKVSKSVWDDLENDLEDENEAFKDTIADEAFDGNENVMATVQAVFSIKTLIAVAAVVVAMFAFILLIFGKYKDKTVIYTGVTDIVASVLGGGVGAIFAAIKSTVEDDALVEGAFATMSTIEFIAAGITLVIGIVLVVVGHSIRKRMRNR